MPRESLQSAYRKICSIFAVDFLVPSEMTTDFFFLPLSHIFLPTQVEKGLNLPQEPASSYRQPPSCSGLKNMVTSQPCHPWEKQVGNRFPSAVLSLGQQPWSLGRQAMAWLCLLSFSLSWPWAGCLGKPIINTVLFLIYTYYEKSDDGHYYELNVCVFLKHLCWKPTRWVVLGGDEY